MQKGLIATLVLILLLGFATYTVAQQGPGQEGQMMGQGQMGGQGPSGSPGADGSRDAGSWYEYDGPDGSRHRYDGSRRGYDEPRHGPDDGEVRKRRGQASPELRQKMQKDMMERMGEVLTKHGMALKEKAKAAEK